MNLQIEKLLKDSCSDDLSDKKHVQQNPNLILAPDNIRKDISVLARMLIKVYVGWPFLQKNKKSKILQILNSLYSIDTKISAQNLYNGLIPILEIIQDGHFSFHFYGRHFCMNQYVAQNVGGNIAGDEKIFTKLRDDGIAVLGLPKMYTGLYSDYKEDYRGNWVMKQLIDFQSDLKKSRALILDLRDNTGGELRLSGEVCNYLHPHKDNFIHKNYFRINPDAMKYNNFTYDKNVIIEDTDIPDLKLVTTNFQSDCITDTIDYKNAIYILTNRSTQSAAELLIHNLKRYSNVKIIGDNTGGALRYSRVRSTVCPHSHIAAFVGTMGIASIKQDFELFGFKPNIKCSGGQDAFNVALQDFYGHNVVNKYNGR